MGAPALISLWFYIQISAKWVLGCSVLSNVLDKQRGDPFRCLGMWIGLTLGNLPILLSASWIAVRFLLEFLGSGITGGRG